jgi:Domain of unknown function (DUF5615)
VGRGARCAGALELLFDEMLSPAVARVLRERGHDVEAVREHPDWGALSDPELVSLAVSERRAIVMNSVRDFRPLHAEVIVSGGSGHVGRVFVPTSVRLTKADAGRIIAALEATLTEYPGELDLANGETWI